MIELIAVLWFVLILIVDLYTDLKLWREQKSVDHRRGAKLRIIGLVPTFLLLFLPLTDLTLLQVLWKGLLVAGMIFSTWWLLFDGIYNYKRGRGWWYNGSVDSDDSKLDIFLRRLSNWQEAALKIGLILLSTTFFIILYY